MCSTGQVTDSHGFLLTATSGINIITDVWILALPIKTLRLINRPRNEKIALTLIFGAGTFAAMMSVVRLQSIYKYTQSTDPFRDAIAVCNLFNPAHPKHPTSPGSSSHMIQ